MTAIIDYALQGQRLLASQFASADNLKKIISALAPAFQELEITLQQIKHLRNISLSTGQQLDDIGAIVGKRRGILIDPDYRNALRTQIAINTCDGSPDSISKIVRAFTSANLVSLIEDFPAKFTIEHDGISSDDLPLLVRAIAPAGVGEITVIQPSGTTIV